MLSPPFRSRKVLDHARGQPCCLRLSGFCNRNPETTVSAHIRDEYKGMGTKASDSSIIFACSDCHMALDEGKWLGRISETDLLRSIIRGMQETQIILIRDGIIGFPHDRRTPNRDKPTPPRKPKDLRTPVPSGRPLQGSSNWPKGRPLQSRNTLRRDT